MALPDWTAGSVYPGIVFTIVRKAADGSAVPIGDLTGATVTGVLRPRNGPERAIVGTLEVTDGPTAEVTYIPDPADVVGGISDVRFTVTFPSGLTPLNTFWARWTVEE